MKSSNISKEDRRVLGVIVVSFILFAAFLPFSIFVLGVRFNYTLRVVAMGGALLGMISGVLGSFAVLRQQSLMGDALSHAALPGVALAFLAFGRQLPALLIGAAIACWVAILFIRQLTKTTRIKQDAAMGVVLSAWFAGGIALLTVIQQRSDASQAGLDSFIFGQAAAMVLDDVYLMGVISLVAAAVLTLFWKEIKLVSFDSGFAEVSGVKVTLVSSLLSVLVITAIVLGLQLAGVILMVGMLIAPGIAARQWTNKLSSMVILAALFGGFAGSTGAVLSALESDIPTGPMIIVIAFSFVLVSIFFAPDRGILWSSIQRGRDRKRFAAQNALRCLYKFANDHNDLDKLIEDRFVRVVLGTQAKLGVQQSLKRGWISKMGSSLQLTPTGKQLGRKDQESLHLWDLYRQFSDKLGVPLIQEERHSDIHDFLDPQTIDRLKAIASTSPLRQRGIVT